MVTSLFSCILFLWVHTIRGGWWRCLDTTAAEQPN